MLIHIQTQPELSYEVIDSLLPTHFIDHPAITADIVNDMLAVTSHFTKTDLNEVGERSYGFVVVPDSFCSSLNLGLKLLLFALSVYSW